MRIYWSGSENKCLLLSVLTNHSLAFHAFIFYQSLPICSLSFSLSSAVSLFSWLSVCLSLILFLSTILQSLLRILGSSCQIDNATGKCHYFACVQVVCFLTSNADPPNSLLVTVSGCAFMCAFIHRQ